MKIKPCSFCGFEPHIEQLFRNYNREKWYALECPQCSARGPEVRTSYNISARWALKAIEEWNNALLKPPILDPGRLAPRISEASIQETCSQFLELDGWRRIRTDLKHLRGMGVQEKGMADDLFIRYWTGCINQIAMKAPYESWGQILWVEWKRERGGNGKRALFTKAEKAKIHQVAWIEQERARGALVLLAGVDFPATIEGFQEFYRQSGLRRRI